MIKEYLDACEKYFATSATRSLNFTVWEPTGYCLLCGIKNCAKRNGYYSRYVFCTEMEFFDKVVIPRFLCKTKNKKFYVIPSFLIPYRTISKLTHQRLFEEYQNKKNIKMAIDEICEGLNDQFYFPLSTAYNCVYFVIREMRRDDLKHAHKNMPYFRFNGIFGIHMIPEKVAASFFIRWMQEQSHPP